MGVLKKLFKYDISSALIPAIILTVVLMITSPGFAVPYNLHSLFQLVSIYLLIGLAQMSALALGQFNLAVGSMGCLSGIVMGYFMQVAGTPVFVAIVIGVAAGALMGFVQGLLIAKSGINPFIITLALLSIYKGLALVITQAQPFAELPEGFKAINHLQIGGVIPLTFIIALAACFIIFWLFRYTSVGKKLQAVGANQRAARFSGINVPRTIMLGHTISGLLCGLAAVLQVARFGSALLSVGDDWMLTSFVVTVLGGTLLSGGKVSVIGTLCGSFLMVLINNGLVIWGVNTYAVQIFMGAVLLGAFEIDRARIRMLARQSELSNTKTEEEGKA